MKPGWEERKKQYWELKKKLHEEGKTVEFHELIKKELKEEKEYRSFLDDLKQRWVEIVIVLGIMTVILWSVGSSMPRFAVHLGRITQSSNEIRERENAQAIVKELLPMFRLQNGSPMTEPRVIIWGECGKDESGRRASAKSISGQPLFPENSIIICGQAAQYPHDRLVRLMKHELVHSWITQSGIQDDAIHGREFMKKALEVGTTIDDQP